MLFFINANTLNRYTTVSMKYYGGQSIFELYNLPVGLTLVYLYALQSKRKKEEIKKSSSASKYNPLKNNLIIKTIYLYGKTNCYQFRRIKMVNEVLGSLVSFGAKVKEMLFSMFSDTGETFKTFYIKGRKPDILSFGAALASEKKYMDSYLKRSK